MTKDKTAEIVTKDIAEKVVKKKRVSPPRPQQSLDHPDSDNVKYLSHSMEIGFLPDIDRRSNEQVTERTMQYFNICKKNQMKPNVAGYALALGCSRIELWHIANGDRKGTPGSVVNTVKKAYALINSQMEDYMQNGKINPVAGIFLMKNNMGYSDKTEIIVESNVNEVEPQMLLEEAEILPDGE